ncbi:arylsulfatase I-like [Schistocerca americana]|uniref:arylsulfatase I-like n=1 Tax=Schistocerca americana TaxID=7009 RepID=UPI001F4FFAB3|nr:arylsulfatase I-like [Schistocerca americana]
MERSQNMHTVLLLAFACLLATSSSADTKPPNIIFILADDMGWNDVSFHGSKQIPTPNIDALAYHGIILNNHYVQPICTPSRAAFMTGKYPIRTGEQGTPMDEHEGRGLPNGMLLPGYLKQLGYVTRAVGKWHLGFHEVELTPTYRGFDSFLGHWGGSIGYFDFIVQTTPDGKELNGYILWKNLTTAWEHAGRYSTDVYTEEAERLILEHDTERPLFLYLAHQACHSGDPAAPVTAPQDTINKFLYISDPNRRIYAGVVSKLDESVGRVVAALQSRGMLENSIIVFTPDNGAPTTGKTANWGSNYPFRGLKATLWEGGVRSPALVWSPLLQNTPRVSHQLMHVTDWLPTFYAAAGGNVSSLPEDLDGVNLWDALVTNAESPRTEVLLNIDEKVGNGAIRIGDWKLVKGVQNNAAGAGYLGASGAENSRSTPAYGPQQVLASPAGQAVSSVLGGSTSPEDMLRLRAQATVSCPDRPQTPLCQLLNSSDVCVYNITQDPCEAGDVEVPEEVLSMLLERLEEFWQQLTPQEESNSHPDIADPARWNYTWVPWSTCNADSSHSFCNVVD